MAQKPHAVFSLYASLLHQCGCTFSCDLAAAALRGSTETSVMYYNVMKLPHRLPSSRRGVQITGQAFILHYEVSAPTPTGSATGKQIYCDVGLCLLKGRLCTEALPVLIWAQRGSLNRNQANVVSSRLWGGEGKKAGHPHARKYTAPRLFSLSPYARGRDPVAVMHSDSCNHRLPKPPTVSPQGENKCTGPETSQ